MKPKNKPNLINFKQKVFDIKNEPMPHGAWWWWFWLFFFNNPKNLEKSRQLMILWSTKNVKEIQCNHLNIKLNHDQDRRNIDGAVAAWYFDGEKMHHKFLLEQCKIDISDKGLSSDSSMPTSFSINKNKNTVRIGNDFKFVTKIISKNYFTRPKYNSNNYIAGKGYSMLKINRLDLSGRIKNKPIHGSAYFQRVFITAPAVPWYWGIFHFENGGILTYFNPHFLGKSLTKNISFFDGKKLHKFTDIDISRSREKIPIFTISSENHEKKINLTVNCYSHSSWTFKEKTFGVIPNKLVYNEYPAVISDLKLTIKKTGERISLEDLGKSVGNAEHTTGLLL